MQIEQITSEHILSVYSGRDGACCCGCAGRHYYNPAYRDEGTAKRGYPVEDSDVSDRMVRRVIRILQDAADLDVQPNDYVATTVGARLYIAYLRDGVTVEE